MIRIQPHHRALIFDCDGTLADSMPVHWIAWHQTLKAHGLDHLMPHDRFMSLGGVPATDIFAMLGRESGRELDAAALSKQKYAAYFEHAGEIGRIEPIVAVALQQKGRLPQAVATGSTRTGVTRTLAAIGMSEHFDAVVCADDVSRPKPDPETFLTAAARLGVEPSACLAFEDAAPGLAAARAAGMDVIDVNDVLAASAAD
ncbi:MAG: HAD family phosphatase [Planctomycetota bacterium]